MRKFKRNVLFILFVIVIFIGLLIPIFNLWLWDWLIKDEMTLGAFLDKLDKTDRCEYKITIERNNITLYCSDRSSDLRISKCFKNLRNQRIHNFYIISDSEVYIYLKDN